MSCTSPTRYSSPARRRISLPVGSLDRRPIGDGDPGPVTSRLGELYVDVIKGNNPKYLEWCSEIPLEDE